MEVQTGNDIIDSILDAYKVELGANYQSYRNHVYRVFNFATILSDAGEYGKHALAIAAAFHDLGIWTAKTFDYLKPSIKLAEGYLLRRNEGDLTELVTNIIDNHHKITSYKNNKLVENFRRADLIDLTFGVMGFGIKRNQLAAVNSVFPYLGFHRFIMGEIVKNIITHPLNPLPIVKV